MRWRAARRLQPSSRRPNRSAPTTRFWRRSRRSRRSAYRRHRRWRRSCTRCCRPCSRFPARRRRKAASSSGCRPMPANWCASARSTRRPATIRRRCWRASKSTRPRPTLRPRSPISASSPTPRARRRRPGLKGPKRARPRLRPRVYTPPIRRARSGHGEGAMIRVILFLLAVAVLAAGFAWVADRPGEVVITWMGYHIETSLMVGALAVAVLVLVLMLLWAIVRGILRSPEQVSLFFRHRRAMKGYLTISRGLLAIGAGDLAVARKAAAEAARLSPGDPLALLLTAQSAQMAGDRDTAEQAFRAMSKRDDTKLLGLRGLYIEAQRRGDAQSARLVAADAAKSQPSLTWAGQAMLDDHCAAADWAGALDALDAMKSGIEKADYRRKRAVLLTARALALDDINRDAARAAVLEAVKLAPDLVPAVALAGRRLAETGEARKASKILNAAWKINPHPDIAEAYANLRFGDSARARLTRMQS